MEKKYCQSCGIPMDDAQEMYGTEKDGTRNGAYCKFCYQNGDFTFDGTMEEMVEKCIPHMPDMEEDKARKYFKELLPTLSRWRTV